MDSNINISDAAKQAVSWLYSDQARNLSVMEARAAILEGFGVAVDRELRSIFAKMDEEGPLRCLVCGGLEPCSHNFDTITWPNTADDLRPHLPDDQITKTAKGGR